MNSKKQEWILQFYSVDRIDASRALRGTKWDDWHNYASSWDDEAETTVLAIPVQSVDDIAALLLIAPQLRASEVLLHCLAEFPTANVSASIASVKGGFCNSASMFIDPEKAITSAAVSLKAISAEVERLEGLLLHPSP